MLEAFACVCVFANLQGNLLILQLHIKTKGKFFSKSDLISLIQLILNVWFKNVKVKGIKATSIHRVQNHRLQNFITAVK